MPTFIGMPVMMGLVKLPAFSDYWSNAMCYPVIAETCLETGLKFCAKTFILSTSQPFQREVESSLKLHQLSVGNQRLKVVCETYM